MFTRTKYTAIAVALTLSFIAGSAFAKGYGYRAWRNSSLTKAKLTTAVKKGQRRVFAPRISVTKGGMCKVNFRAMRNSALQGKSWDYVDMKKADPAIKACQAGLMDVLRGGATPAFGVALFSPDGARVSHTQSAKGKPAKISVRGFKGKTLQAVLLLPTSAHGGLKPDALVKAGQAHTVWINQNNNTTPGSGKMVVDGAGAKGWVTAVQATIPVQKGTNYLLFDPKPGMTAGVGGFAEGRTVQIDIN